VDNNNSVIISITKGVIMKLKIKELSANNRGMEHMAIRTDTKKTVIFLHAVSKTTGEDQWYESKVAFTNKTALNYFYSGQYSCVFAGGLTKSSNTDWI
tara:strand:- start:2296 stop:2589 length:294 start_codon:yes stop_codon:yes gene_type:complete